MFNEIEEMELAAELLNVSDEYEMEQFIGNLIKGMDEKLDRDPKSRKRWADSKKRINEQIRRDKKVRIKFRKDAISSTRTLVRILKKVAKTMASTVRKGFGLEFEGLSTEDQEFEVARRFVRLAGDAAKQVAQTPMSVPAHRAATVAVKVAAQKHTPGLVRTGIAASPSWSGRREGRWIRRGSRIILFGV